MNSDENYPRSSYLSPNIKNNYSKQDKKSSFIGNKNYYSSQNILNHMHHSETLTNQNYHLKVMELQHTIYELKSSLHQIIKQSQEWQNQLHNQKVKCFELNEVKRKLTEQLGRMEFQFQRIGNYQELDLKQKLIRAEDTQKENCKLHSQITTMTNELKNTKQQYKELIIENTALKKQYEECLKQQQMLFGIIQQIQNKNKDQSLQNRIQQSIWQERQQKEKEQNLKNKQNLKTEQNIIKCGNIMNFQNPFNIEEHINVQKNVQQEQLIKQSYEQQQLRDQFYQQNVHKPIQTIQTDQNEQIAQYSLQKYRTKLQQQEIQSKVMLKTVQKDVLHHQILQLQNSVINQLINKCYYKAIKVSQQQQQNSLKIFNQQLKKKIISLSQMAKNYLQARSIALQQSNCQLEPKYQQLQIINQSQIWLDKIFKSVKVNAKKQANKQMGYQLALFRLLTIIDKVENVNPLLLNYVKHTALKYVQKIMKRKQKDINQAKKITQNRQIGHQKKQTIPIRQDKLKKERYKSQEKQIHSHQPKYQQRYHKPNKI